MQSKVQVLLAGVQAEFDKLETDTRALRVYVGRIEDDNWALAERNSRMEQDRKRALDLLSVIDAHINPEEVGNRGAEQLLTVIGMLVKEFLGEVNCEGR